MQYPALLAMIEAQPKYRLVKDYRGNPNLLPLSQISNLFQSLDVLAAAIDRVEPASKTAPINPATTWFFFIFPPPGVYLKRRTIKIGQALQGFWDILLSVRLQPPIGEGRQRAHGPPL